MITVKVNLFFCSKDLWSAVERISLFLGKQLSNEQLANVVKHSTFNNMRKIPQASYKQVSDALLNHHQGSFMRKGNSVYCGTSTQEHSLLVMMMMMIIIT